MLTWYRLRMTACQGQRPWMASRPPMMRRTLRETPPSVPLTPHTYSRDSTLPQKRVRVGRGVNDKRVKLNCEEDVNALVIEYTIL